MVGDPGIIQGPGINYFDSPKDQGNNQGREIFEEIQYLIIVCLSIADVPMFRLFQNSATRI